MLRYLSALKYSSMVIGNSSSGLLEAPSFGIPTINIGNRQKGRIQAESVINCQPRTLEIMRAIQEANSKEVKERAKKIINPYGDGNTSSKIVEVIREYMKIDNIDLKKKFYNFEVK
jgi:GDP/UDP-N,N'-diacetylbacillosamine 2-epimerase (hydrolysing)